MNAYDKYSLLNRDDSMEIIQTNLSEKQKTFSQFCFAFMKSSLTFEHFKKKGSAHTWRIFEIMDSEKRGEINV